MFLSISKPKKVPQMELWPVTVQEEANRQAKESHQSNRLGRHKVRVVITNIDIISQWIKIQMESKVNFQR